MSRTTEVGSPHDLSTTPIDEILSRILLAARKNSRLSRDSIYLRGSHIPGHRRRPGTLLFGFLETEALGYCLYCPSLGSQSNAMVHFRSEVNCWLLFVRRIAARVKILSVCMLGQGLSADLAFPASKPLFSCYQRGLPFRLWQDGLPSRSRRSTMC